MPQITGPEMRAEEPGMRAGGADPNVYLPYLPSHGFLPVGAVSVIAIIGNKMA